MHNTPSTYLNDMTERTVSTVTKLDNRNFPFHLPRNCKFEVWRNSDGVIDRDDGPAVIAKSDLDGRVQLEAWYRCGELHRDDGPALSISEFSDAAEMLWYQNGKVHRDGAPASIITENLGPNSVNIREQWSKAGQCHRIGGPAYVSVSASTGVVCREHWSVEGKLHRLDGPSEIERDEETGIVIEESWSLHGEFHRLDGPAIIRRDRLDGSIIEQGHYRNGQPVSAPQATARNPA